MSGLPRLSQIAAKGGAASRLDRPAHGAAKRTQRAGYQHDMPLEAEITHGPPLRGSRFLRCARRSPIAPTD